MKTKSHLWFIKKTNLLLTGLIALLGFGVLTSCEKDDNTYPLNNSEDNPGGNPITPPNNGEDFPVEYGTPNAKFSIKGKVIDSENNAIPNISLFILDEHKFEVYLQDSIKSNANGEFNTTFSSFPNEQFLIVAKDRDGLLNRHFKTDTIKVSFTKDDYYEKGEGWYAGAAKKEVTIVMKKKEL